MPNILAKQGFSPKLIKLFILGLLFPLFASMLSGCGLIKAQLPGKSQFADSSTRIASTPSDDAPLPECEITAEKWAAFPPLPVPDLWDRIRSGYALPEHDNKRIDAERAWYARHQEYLDRVARRGSRYLFHIVEQLEQRQLPMELALLPIVESAFDPFAYSHGRASGMWQIIPGTGKMLGLKQNWWYDGRRDIVASTNAALNYLESLNKRFQGDWLLALAAYNSGAGNVSKAIRKNKKRGKPLDFWSLDLPRETKSYVPKLLALSQLVRSPDAHNVSFITIANEPHFETVDAESQIDLAQAAELAEIDMDTLYHLNPAFNRWATDPKGPHTLLVPIGQGEVFNKHLADIPKENRVTWERYTIKSGDSLSTIAKKYQISISSLKRINNMRSHFLRAGKTLMVPVAAKSESHYSFSSMERLRKTHASNAKRNKGERVDHLVKSGESLWTIGKRYKLSARKIAKWNNMAPTDTLSIGQTLVIWKKANSPVNAIAKKTVLPKTNNGVVRKLSYRVRTGDSLYRIANKFKVKVADILRWNPIKKSTYLQPGQTLTLFIDVTQVM